MFLALPGEFESTNEQISARSARWWHQTGLGGPGTCSTRRNLCSRNVQSATDIATKETCFFVFSAYVEHVLGPPRTV